MGARRHIAVVSRDEPSGFSAVQRALCDEHAFGFLDLKPILVEESKHTFVESGALLWWRDDTHWNGAGQRVAAAAIYENVLRRESDRRVSRL